MQLKKILERWDLTSLKIKTPFRAELHDPQTDLRNYTRLLADLADVEGLSDLEAC